MRGLSRFGKNIYRSDPYNSATHGADHPKKAPCRDNPVKKQGAAKANLLKGTGRTNQMKKNKTNITRKEYEYFFFS